MKINLVMDGPNTISHTKTFIILFQPNRELYLAKWIRLKVSYPWFIQLAILKVKNSFRCVNITLLLSMHWMLALGYRTDERYDYKFMPSRFWRVENGEWKWLGFGTVVSRRRRGKLGLCTSTLSTVFIYYLMTCVTWNPNHILTQSKMSNGMLIKLFPKISKHKWKTVLLLGVPVQAEAEQWIIL